VIRQQLASEAAPRHCYYHQDRPAQFVRVEDRAKPLRARYRVPECRECADRKIKQSAERETLGVFAI
jgi:hypothetical protein